MSFSGIGRVGCGHHNQNHLSDRVSEVARDQVLVAASQRTVGLHLDVLLLQVAVWR